MPHVFYEGHQVGRGADVLGVEVLTSSVVQVWGVGVVFVDAWHNWVYGIVVKDGLEVVFVFVADWRLILVTESALVTCNACIDVVTLVLVVVWIAVRVKSLAISIVYLIVFWWRFHIQNSFIVYIFLLLCNFLLLRIKINIKLLESLLITCKLFFKFLFFYSL